ncbi:hypothetical protein HBI56_185980 [Parastagonospora nodorum]|nr:hypothetical protein HBH54_085640 [Parastagonospora nodorum]KAH4160004.1 hypothetical protein HBH43_180370 [Parastagonospora nodorum]KAH4171612.1 hypothetical protein HBH44_023660 [Parastagonospora nodorum]KAH4194501.1 hypothetical protein HBI95_198690 [Parastagonospora nodorum]KAH4293558.1 hypothetical protein HBI02_182270 [Parastagonospora nodorum]
MTFSEIAGRLLKGSGYSHTPSSSKDQPLPPGLSFDRESGASFLTSPGSDSSQVLGCGGMVGSNFGEPIGHSTNASSWARIRPLSDIRELTEPSLADTLLRKPVSEKLPRSTSRPDLSRKPSVASKRRPSVDHRNGENREPDRKISLESNGIRSVHRGRSFRTPSPPSPADNNSISSIYSIPHGNVPRRSSSRTRARSTSKSRPPLQHITQRAPATTTLNMVPSIPPPDHTIPRRGHSQSPVRHVAARLDPISHDTNRRIPSRTFVREPISKELLEFPSHRHPRIDLGLDLLAGIFVGGGSIEGTVQINVDDAERIRHRRTLDIARISIDLLGIEEISGNRRCVFMNLATELLDEKNPPPANMVDTQEPISPRNVFWHLMPSVTNLAFNLSLPLNVGPPPFQSKNARIRYVLCVSLLVRDHGRQYIVRTSEDVTVLSVYDPEKALMSLPSPLTASDEWVKPRETTLEVVRVTAGLHRQVWVSGTSIYVDVHIANNSRKTVKKIELQLERDILCYNHAAASTMEKSAGQARIFDNNDRSILSKSMVKQGSAGWHGVSTHQTHIRTCDLELPRGLGTVKCGKYFEVRYFLNVIVSSTHTKLVIVQLPIVLIHMNSLDVVPNSVAQVAMAIEEKRSLHTHQRNPSMTRRPSQSVQGRAFAAPRMQSLERMRARADDIQDLSQALDQSPRKFTLHRTNSNWDYRTPPSNRKGRILGDGEAADLKDRLRRVCSNATVGSKPNLHRDSSTRSHRGTTSALGFREAEVREDMELAGLGETGEVRFKQRLEQSRERQYRFSKKKSMERWKGVANVGVGWLKGGGSAREERERDGWV